MHTHHNLPLLLLLMLAASFPTAAQRHSKEVQQVNFDLFAGIDLNYRDINYIRQYDVLLNLTPGCRLTLPHRWSFAAQGIVPIVNQYGNYYERPRLDMAVISKETAFSDLLYTRVSAGFFSLNRYGFDAKLFAPINDYLAFEAQGGYTGYFSMATGWEMSSLDRFSGTIGGDIYIPSHNIQLRGVIGTYALGDQGFEGEIMRHFNHTSVILHGKWSNAAGLDACFKFVTAIPPYHRSSRHFHIRPASYFRFTNSIKYRILTNRMYHTDPEENERSGWFSAGFLPWGTYDAQPDFTTGERRSL